MQLEQNADSNRDKTRLKYNINKQNSFEWNTEMVEKCLNLNLLEVLSQKSICRNCVENPKYYMYNKNHREMHTNTTRHPQMSNGE